MTIQNNIQGNSFSLFYSSSGQVLLITIIIIFAISLAILLTATKGLISTMSLFPEKIAYYKSYYAGVSCTDIALLNFKNDVSYPGNENIAISSDMNCQILPIESNSDIKLIKVIGVSAGLQRYFLVTIKKVNDNGIDRRYKLETIQEVDSFN